MQELLLLHALCARFRARLGYVLDVRHFEMLFGHSVVFSTLCFLVFLSRFVLADLSARLRPGSCKFDGMSHMRLELVVAANFERASLGRFENEGALGVRSRKAPGYCVLALSRGLVGLCCRRGAQRDYNDRSA